MAEIYNYEEFNQIINSLETEQDAFKNKEIAHLIINKNKVISSNLTEGLSVNINQLEDGVEVELIVEDNVKIKHPVFVCFAMFHQKGLQLVRSNVKIGNNGHLSLISICNFIEGHDVFHNSKTNIEIGANSSYHYFERHYHPNDDDTKIKIKAKTKSFVGVNSYYKNEFEILKGRVGKLDISSEAEVEKDGVMELGMFFYGKKDDNIKIKEIGHLKGENSRGFLNSRIAVKDNSYSEIYSELIAYAPYAKGHVDCTEIIQDNAIARAIPIIEVKNKLAHITHEAALGSVDSKELQTLMAKGLTEEEATDLIIKGLLRRK